MSKVPRLPVGLALRLRLGALTFRSEDTAAVDSPLPDSGSLYLVTSELPFVVL